MKKLLMVVLLIFLIFLLAYGSKKLILTKQNQTIENRNVKTNGMQEPD